LTLCHPTKRKLYLFREFVDDADEIVGGANAIDRLPRVGLS
jgi:hypothetical protein